jgi:hypothetical protein
MKQQVILCGLAVLCAGGLALSLAVGGPPLASATMQPESVSAAAPTLAPAATPRARRVVEMVAHDPGLGGGEIDRLLAASDAVGCAIQTEDGTSVGQEVRRRLREAEVSTAEARAYYAAHPDLFGHRGFAESRWTVEQLVAIERVRAELGLVEGSAP